MWIYFIHFCFNFWYTPFCIFLSSYACTCVYMFVCVYVVCSYYACVLQWSCMVSGQVERLSSLIWSCGSRVWILLRSSDLISASDPLWWPRKSHYSQHNAFHKKTTFSLVISALIFRFHLCFMTKDSFCYL